MGRPIQDGLLYFSFDTDFFYADKRIKRIKARLGTNGLLFYIYLLTEIYRHGYYIRWTEESVEDAIDTLSLTEGFIEQAMICLTDRGLITRIVQHETAVITSPGIQKRYQAAVKGLKRDIVVDPEIWLLNKEETAPCIKFTPKDYKSEKNQSKSEKNQSKSEKNDIKEIKEKKRKGINTMCKADALALFEQLWEQYPVKKGKGQVSDVKKMKLLEIGLDEMSRAIKRYLAGLEKDSWRKPQNGSTFFNSGYVDYLDCNYAEESKSVSEKASEALEAEQNQDSEDEELLDEEEWWNFGLNADRSRDV